MRPFGKNDLSGIYHIAYILDDIRLAHTLIYGIPDQTLSKYYVNKRMGIYAKSKYLIWDS